MIEPTASVITSPSMEWRRGTKRHPIVAEALEMFSDLKPDQVIKIQNIGYNTARTAFRRRFGDSFQINRRNNTIYIRKRRSTPWVVVATSDKVRIEHLGCHSFWVSKTKINTVKACPYCLSPRNL